ALAAKEIALAAAIPETDVYVPARAEPTVIGLGHERDRSTVEIGELFRSVLEEREAVGRLEGVGIAQIDLVLANAGLALRELDRNPGGAHLIAQLAVEGLGLGRLEQLVVFVVGAEALEILISLPLGLVVAIGKQIELELAGQLDGEAK